MTQDFHIQSLFYHTLTNGFRDDINENPEILGFILGAIDNNFSVKMPGCIIAKYGSIDLMCYRSGDKVIAWFKKVKMFEMGLGINGFTWDKVEIRRGNFYYDGKYICNSTKGI